MKKSKKIKLMSVALLMSSNLIHSAASQASVSEIDFAVLGQPQSGNVVTGKIGGDAFVSDQAKAYLTAIKHLLAGYGITSDKFWNLVFSERSVYTLRKSGEMPCHDLAEAGEFPYGCTQDGDTYLDAEIFQKGEFQQQILGLIHERLHAFVPQVGKDDHYRIAQMVAGIQVLIERFKKQEAGDRSALLIEELEAIKMLFRRAKQLAFEVEFFNPCELVIKGGGCKNRSVVDDQSFVGVGSSIFKVNLIKTEVMKSRVFSGGRELPIISGSQISSCNLFSNTLNIQDSVCDHSEILASSEVKVVSSSVSNSELDLDIKDSSDHPQFVHFNQTQVHSLRLKNVYLGTYPRAYGFTFAGAQMDFSSYGQIRYQCMSSIKEKDSFFMTPEEFVSSRKLIFKKEQ